MADYVKETDTPPLPEETARSASEWINRLRDGKKGPHGGHILEELQLVMMENVGIYRNKEDMTRAVEKIQELRGRYLEVRVQDTSPSYNTDLPDLMELGNLLDLALITAVSALNRTESRGAHSREDFPERDDAKWLKHTLAFLNDDQVRIDYKAVDTSIWPPKARNY